jgi:hypothetical protein
MFPPAPLAVGNVPLTAGRMGMPVQIIQHVEHFHESRPLPRRLRIASLLPLQRPSPACPFLMPDGRGVWERGWADSVG